MTAESARSLVPDPTHKSGHVTSFCGWGLGTRGPGSGCAAEH